MWTHHTHANLRVIIERHEHLRAVREHGRLRRDRRTRDESSDVRPGRQSGHPPSPI